MIDELRVWAGYDTRAVDILTPARYLRLPGAASPKPAGDFSRPIAVDGTPLPASTAADRAHSALSEIAAATAELTIAAGGHTRSRPTKKAEITTERVVRTLAQDVSSIVVTDVAPRAWPANCRCCWRSGITSLRPYVRPGGHSDGRAGFR